MGDSQADRRIKDGLRALAEQAGLGPVDPDILLDFASSFAPREVRARRRQAYKDLQGTLFDDEPTTTEGADPSEAASLWAGTVARDEIAHPASHVEAVVAATGASAHTRGGPDNDRTAAAESPGPAAGPEKEDGLGETGQTVEPSAGPDGLPRPAGVTVLGGDVDTAHLEGAAGLASQSRVVVPFEEYEGEASDFSFPVDTTGFYPSSVAEKVSANIEAVRLVKRLEAAHRLANTAEQGVLAKYVGWGGLANEFFDTSKSRFMTERAELRSLVDRAKWEGMEHSAFTAYYTEPGIIKGIFEAVRATGFTGGRVLDPAMGSGNFFAAMPSDLKAASTLFGVELDPVTGLIARQLHQSADVRIQGFETTGFLEGSMDLVVTNVPFGDISVADERYGGPLPIHDYFIRRSLDLVHEGGLVAVITSVWTMDKRVDAFRRELAAQANLVGGVRLPDDAFTRVAGTKVSSDILVFQKSRRPLFTAGVLEELDRPRDWRDEKLSEDMLNLNSRRWLQTYPERIGGHEVEGLFENEWFNQDYSWDRRPYPSRFSDPARPRTLGEVGVEHFHGNTLVIRPDPAVRDLGEAAASQLSRDITAVGTVFTGSPTRLVEEARQEPEPVEVPEPVAGLEPYTHGVAAGRIYYHDGNRVRQDVLERSVRVPAHLVGTEYEDRRLGAHRAEVYETADEWEEVPKAGDPDDLERRLVARVFYYTQDHTPEQVSRVSGMLGLKEMLVAWFDEQQTAREGLPAGLVASRLAGLNSAYDLFVGAYGFLHDPENRALMRNDDYYPLLCSVEEEVEGPGDGRKTYVKSDVFRQPTVRPDVVAMQVDSARDALLSSLNLRGRVDLAFMQSVYPGSSRDSLIKALAGEMFIDPERALAGREDCWASRAEYLSGDVKSKLELLRGPDGEPTPDFEALARLVAEQALPYDLSRHMGSLEAVQPTDLGFEAIDFHIGSTWLALDVYRQFMREELGHPAEIDHDPVSASYSVSDKSQGSSEERPATTVTYGLVLGAGDTGVNETRYNGLYLFEALLNNHRMTVRFKDSEGTSHESPVLTAQMRAKAELMQAKFKDYARQNHATEIIEDYNRVFNRIVPRDYKTDVVDVKGLSTAYSLRPHQREAVNMIVATRRQLMAHEVGSGKTLTMLAGGVKLKDLGVVRKPLYVVPKNLTGQFGEELLRYFPTRKVLIVSDYDFTKPHRKEFIGRIANGSYDAVVIGDTQFNKIPVSPRLQEEWILEELHEAKAAKEGHIKRSLTFKVAKALEESLTRKLTDLRSQPRDQAVCFEQLGVDMLFVDEAHNYKNFAHPHTLGRVAGLSAQTSMRAADLDLKAKYLHSLHEGRNVVLATGTPITNSVSELYTMMRYLMPDVLEGNGLGTFDRFAANFGKIGEAYEATPSGSYRLKQRFSNFTNVPELMNIFKTVANIQTSRTLDLDVPSRTVIPVISDKSEEMEAFFDQVADRALALGPRPQKGEDNMLSITNDARLASLDLRLVDSVGYAGLVPGKLRQLTANVVREYEASMEARGTQIVFSDLGTPGGTGRRNPDGTPNRFTVYGEVKRLLVCSGIPPSQVAFIHDAKDEGERSRLFAKVRRGEVRILLASTAKGGTGVNVQDRVVAVHHLDIPWRPADLTQRDGRAVRQGNMSRNVNVYEYSTRGTLDSFLWQTLDNKVRFIGQIMDPAAETRSVEEVGEQTAVSTAEMMSAVADNPFTRPYNQARQSLERLSTERDVFYSALAHADKTVARSTAKLEEVGDLVDRHSQDALAADARRGLDFWLKSETGGIYHEGEGQKKAAGEDIIGQIRRLDSSWSWSRPSKVGKYRGFELWAKAAPPDNLFGQDVATLIIRGAADHSLGLDLQSGLGTITRIDNRIERIPDDLAQVRARQQSLRHGLEEAEKVLSVTEFPREADYQAARALKAELEEKVASANEEYEQARKARMERRQARSEEAQGSGALGREGPDIC